MVRVVPSLVLAISKPPYAGVEVVEGEGEVTSVASGRVKAEARDRKHADPDERQDLEADERWLLRQLVDGDAAGGENGDTEHAVDVVVSDRFRPEGLEIKLSAADNNDIVVVQ